MSTDLREWRRLGPVLFRYDDALDMDLNLFHNKDTVFFPEPVTAPDGTESLAVLHRPMWNLDETKIGQGVRVPAGIDDPRQSIWISYVPLAAVLDDIFARSPCGSSTASSPGPSTSVRGAQDRRRSRRRCACPRAGSSSTTASPARSTSAFEQQRNVNYAAGALLLDADDPSRVIARTPEPLLAPETEEERSGIVPNVVFPTAIEASTARYSSSTAWPTPRSGSRSSTGSAGRRP